MVFVIVGWSRCLQVVSFVYLANKMYHLCPIFVFVSKGAASIIAVVTAKWWECTGPNREMLLVETVLFHECIFPSTYISHPVLRCDVTLCLILEKKRVS